VKHKEQKHNLNYKKLIIIIEERSWCD